MNTDKQATTAKPAIIRSLLLGIPHGFFDRRCGISPFPYSSRNLSYGVGDTAANVATNRRQIKNMLAAAVLVSASQVHLNKVYRAGDLRQDTEVEGFDALITDSPGIGLLVQQADCQAILLHDPIRKAIAAIHCGWRGSVLNIIKTTVERMRQDYRTDPGDLYAAISPSLGPCCAEFVNFQAELPKELHSYQTKPNFFDFWEISRMQLTVAGVKTERIDIARICTCCSPAYFSYRRSRKKGRPATGRHGSLICLR